MAQCAQCMYENEPGVSACEQCGADLSMEVLSLQLGEVCRSCDSYNDPGVRVCVSCGKPLGDFIGEPVTLDDEDDVRPVAPPAATPAPGQSWMAPPDTGEYSSAKKPAERLATLPTEPHAASPAARGPSPLPPGALPPGWMSSSTRPAPAIHRSGQEAPVACPKCRSENLPSARYCGKCGTGLLPNPAATKARGKLILIRGLAGEGRQFQLNAASNTAGRSEGAVAFPEDPYISAMHATFTFRGNDLVVKDEGTPNGIYVRLREAQPLRAGDMFNIGERLLRYGGTAVIPATSTRHGSPRTSDRLQVLEEVLEGGGTGRVCKRAGPVITIGRASCDLNFPSDGFVSARHAELSLAGETAFLRDLGSANGTFVRVPSRTERVLSHGDYLMMGRELLRVELASHAA